MSQELRYGPQTAAVEAMLERLRRATGEELRALAETEAVAGPAAWAAAWDAAWDAARDAAWDAARAAARDAAWDAARAAAWDAGDDARAAAWDAGDDAWAVTSCAILAVLVRDIIAPEDFATLTDPWRHVFGPTWEEARHTSRRGGRTMTTTPTTIADAQERLLEAIAAVVHQVDDLVDVVPTRHAPAIQLLEDLASRILESVRINDSIAGQELRGWLFDLNQVVDLLKG